MQNRKTTLELIKVATIWILSRIFDVLPMAPKVNVLGRFTGRFSERLIFAGKSRSIKWEVPDLNKKVKLKVSNKDDYFALLARGLVICWEKETLKAWVQATRNQDGNQIAIDVGAYFGLFSIIAASGEGVNHVIAIEPNPNTVPKLRHNIRINNCQNKVDVVEKACGSHKEFLHLMIPRGRKTSSGAQMAESQLNNKIDWEDVGAVEVLPLDDFLTISQINRVVAIKIDAEGFEMEVLGGGNGNPKSRSTHCHCRNSRFWFAIKSKRISWRIWVFTRQTT
jgi:FkbM family methyltransferase